MSSTVECRRLFPTGSKEDVLQVVLQCAASGWLVAANGWLVAANGQLVAANGQLQATRLCWFVDSLLQGRFSASFVDSSAF